MYIYIYINIYIQIIYIYIYVYKYVRFFFAAHINQELNAAYKMRRSLATRIAMHRNSRRALSPAASPNKSSAKAAHNPKA